VREERDQRGDAEMTIELDTDEHIALIYALGMSVSMAQERDMKELVPLLMRIVGKLAPDSYYALKPEGGE
jgi:hypothetical protein